MGILGRGVLLYAIGMGYFQAVVDWFLNNLFWGIVLIILILLGYGYLTGKIKDWLGR